MRTPVTPGCSEYQLLSRRGLVGSFLSTLPQVVYTQDLDIHRSFVGATRDILVTVFLRGGADGLMMVAPYGDNGYSTRRRNTMVKPPSDADVYRRAVDLDGFFGLPPAMSPLKEIYSAGNLLFAHMTGSLSESRSHFDRQQFVEVGADDKSLFQGWVGRHLASVTETTPGAVLRAVGLGANLPLILDGGPKTTAISNLEDVSVGGAWGSEGTVQARLDWLVNAYKGADPQLKASAENVAKTIGVLKKINFGSYAPGGGAVYNGKVSAGGQQFEIPWFAQDFGNSMKAAAAIIKANVGVEAVHVDFGGWDSHDNQWMFEGRNGTTPSFGDYFWRLRSLAANLAAFFKDLDASSLMTKVTVVVVSEFGRTATENGNNGTDHGHGGVMMFMGRNVNGNRVDRDWKALNADGVDGYGGLKITVDHRIYLGEMLDKRLGNGGQLGKIFPGFVKPASGWRGAFK